MTNFSVNHRQAVGTIIPTALREPKRQEVSSMKKLTTGLQDNDIHNPRKLLLNEQADLLVALGINSHRLAAGQEIDADPERLLQEESVNLGLNEVLYTQLRLVEEALVRLDVGEYGYCQGCGDSIAPNRLRSVPWTPYCLGCQEKTSFLNPAELIGAEARISR
jgi:DnaK suppressor protein